jgi:hypothetical protein
MYCERRGGGSCNKWSYIYLLEGVKSVVSNFVTIIMAKLWYAYIASRVHFRALEARVMLVLCARPYLLQ